MTEQIQDNAYTATIGFFDGVHVGHQYLLHQLRTCANQRKQKSLVVSFDQHPRKVLNADFRPQLLTDNTEKEILLSNQQIDKIAFLRFTPAMSQLTAAEFMRDILIGQLNVKTLLLGYDHCFGSDKLHDFSDYERIAKSLGMEVVLQEQFIASGQHVSSSHIRKLIADSQIEMANELLGHEYTLSGKVVKGFQVGRKIGFPTANIQPSYPYKIIPPTGVYAVRVEIVDNTYCGMLNIGVRPTIHAHVAQSIEVNIFDFDRKIYDEHITVRFVKKMREEQKFASIDDLKQQLIIDRDEVRKLFFV